MIKSASEIEDQTKHVIINGMVESDTEVLPERVSKILLEIGKKPAVGLLPNRGSAEHQLSGPIKFTVSSSDVEQLRRDEFTGSSSRN